jgi:D-glycero-D-manno-heptose 1,7-bisphosphate phosphatase
MTAVALLDRDGTINVKAMEGEYVTLPEQIVLIPRAAEAIALLNQARVPVALVTNQRGIALGHMTEEDLLRVNRRVSDLLADFGAHIDLWLHCPHLKNECSCRKPAPGMLRQALAVLGGTAAKSVMIGDSQTDIEAARAADVPGVWLTTRPDVAAEARATTLFEAVTRWLRSLAPAVEAGAR